MGEASIVGFDDVDAKIEKTADTQLVVTAPPHDPGQVNVVVTTPAGNSAPIAYTFNTPVE